MALKMSIEGLRFRASDGNLKAADQLRILRQRLSNPAGMPRGRAGDNPADMMGYLAVRQPVDLSISEIGGVSAPAVTRAAIIEPPEMIALSDKLSIMKGEVTVGLFRQVMQGYEITGRNADDLQAILADPSNADNALNFVSLLDGREFARRLSDLTGRKFRVQTEGEWEQAREKLSGDNWTWTETKFNDQTFVLRRLGNDGRINFYPEGRFDYIAVRLVEDL
ncbi:MAG: SUMF1/EgtB/PvdO family nonheme iron enzyme [Candidatus Margulisbacteria bacterium]|nr:SUMF1/EgtB/PvdO family nonheme iron enzyme [Candidatus Margulisiibacteriota bacterium]